MRRFLSLLLLGFGLSVSVSAQTARDYFKELKAANTFRHYKDEYVCFRDDDVPTFMVIAKGSDIVEMMKKNGEKDVRMMSRAKDDLFVQTYYKGVGSEEYIYEPVKQDQIDETNKEYSYEFGGKNPGKMVYSINWATGRYLQRLYMYQQSKSVAAKEGSGRCELIHPVQF